jgi:hypothetical protein
VPLKRGKAVMEFQKMSIRGGIVPAHFDSIVRAGRLFYLIPTGAIHVPEEFVQVTRKINM